MCCPTPLEYSIGESPTARKACVKKLPFLHFFSMDPDVFSYAEYVSDIQ
jgi:hypothetical protein